MLTLRTILRPTRIVDAHCDIPCGIYDPEQARIEAESCLRVIEKHDASDDALFKARCIHVKEERAELVKHHLDVLWHDYFKPEHLEKYPDLHETFWKATKQASKVKQSLDAGAAKELLSMIDTSTRCGRPLAASRRPGSTDDLPERPMRPRALIWIALGVVAAFAARRWLDVVEVRGRSMAPTLLPGDRLLVVRARPRPGDVVLAVDPRNPSRELIKRVASVYADDVSLLGDNPIGEHERHGGDRRVRWRAVARYWPAARATVRLGRPQPPDLRSWRAASPPARSRTG